jgi:hypothetical protein
LTEIEETIKLKLLVLISNLESPLPSYEIENGWDDELRMRWSDNFNKILVNIENGSPCPDASIPRAMDFDGICKGVYLELGAEISGLLRQRIKQG